MAKQADTPGGSWPLVEELLERGDPDFVTELRKITDADRLGGFAVRWYDDPRPTARRFLLDYLSRPLNALRHEPLVKRLFKLAEKREDDEVMAAFLLAPVAAARQAVIYRKFLDNIEPAEHPYHRDDPAGWLRNTVALLAER